MTTPSCCAGGIGIKCPPARWRKRPDEPRKRLNACWLEHEPSSASFGLVRKERSVAKRRLDEILSQAGEAAGPSRASSRLKSRIYSALMLEEAVAGPLRSVTETKADGRV